MKSTHTFAAVSAMAVLMSTAAIAGSHTEAGVDMHDTGVAASVNAHASTDIKSDAVDATRRAGNAVGDAGSAVIEGAGNVASDVVDGAKAVGGAVVGAGADVMFSVETAFEAGTTQVTSLDGVDVGTIVGVKVLDGGAQMVSLDLNDDLGFEADNVSVSSEVFVKGDGVIVLNMEAKEFAETVAMAADVKAKAQAKS